MILGLSVERGIQLRKWGGGWRDWGGRMEVGNSGASPVRRGWHHCLRNNHSAIPRIITVIFLRLSSQDFISHGQVLSQAIAGAEGTFHVAHKRVAGVFAGKVQPSSIPGSPERAP